MIRYLILVLCIWTSFAKSYSQENYLDTANLIPNPSFEEFTTFPLGWFYKGEHYSELIRFWSSPTGASPDAYGPDIIVPSSWRKNGFGGHSPYEGNAMSGITVYGCEDGKPHCREFVQVPLMEPLVTGQKYHLSFAFSHLVRSIQIDKLGFAFEMDPIDAESENPITSDRAVYTPGIKSCKGGQWKKIEHSFQATQDASYLIIGNFDADEKTEALKGGSERLNFAYYYIDNVQLKKIPPIIDRPISDGSILNKKLAIGETIRLHNIYFDTDKIDFHPISFVELNELHKILLDNPNLKIEVRGHTDDQGTDEYNQILSLNRAEAVAQYLFDHSIAIDRVKFRGFGSAKPIAENSTDDGRQENRRVEFIVLDI